MTSRRRTRRPLRKSVSAHWPAAQRSGGSAWTMRPSESGTIESTEIHDLVPRGNEIAHELLPCVVARIDLRERAELGVRPENQVNAAAGPLELARPAIAALESLPGFRGRLPRRAHVEQVHEEVVGQRPGPPGEDAERGLPVVRIQDAQTAHEHGHLGSAESQQ